MPRYRFHATDTSGRALAGEIDAGDEKGAREQLVQQGLTGVQLHAPGEDEPLVATLAAPLNHAEAEDVLGYLARASRSPSLLVDGLKAAAAESSNRRVRQALRQLARQIEQGRSPQDALTESSQAMPPHVRGLVAAAARTGRLGEALDELIEHHRSLRSMTWDIWSALAYPLFVMTFASFILVAFLVWIVPPFDTMFQEMDLELPSVTKGVVETSRTLVSVVYGPTKWGVLAVVMGLSVMVGLLASGRGGSHIQHFVQLTPIVGPLWTWSSTSGFMKLLATLLEHQVPLPEALRLTADGISNADMRRSAQTLAGGVEQGRSLSQLVNETGNFPKSSVPILKWGEQAGSLASAAQTLSQLFADRVEARAAWLRTVAPPVVYLFVLFTLGLAITSLLAPMVSLITALS